MSDTQNGRVEPKRKARRGFVRRTLGKAGMLAALGMGAIAIVVMLMKGETPQLQQMSGVGEIVDAAFRPVNIPQPLPKEDPPASPPQASGVNPNPPQVPDNGGVMDNVTGSATQGKTKKKKSTVYFATATQPVSGASSPAAATGGGPAGQERKSGTSIAYKDTEIPGRRAGPAIDQTFLMRPGVYSFVLDADVNSEREGPFFAHAKTDIKSPLGVTLIDAGTQVTGTYSSQVGDGQERVVMVSAYGITPNGVPFTLGSQMGDNRGVVGVAGQLNRHTWDKIKGAVFLMAAQGSIRLLDSAVQSALQKGGGTNFNINTGSLDSTLAEIVRSGSRIQSTVGLSAGKDVSLLVTEPTDFSQAYSLRTR